MNTSRPVVLVTRPGGQGQDLVGKLALLPVQTLLMPTLDICPVADPASSRQRLEEHRDADNVVFVSINSVSLASELIDLGSYLKGKNVFAVGKATASALQEYHSPVCQPAGKQTSEGLLDHPELQHVKSRKILLLNAPGGRDLLKTELTRRGASVIEIPVYQRKPVEHFPAEWPGRLASGETLIITVTSSAILDALLAGTNAVLASTLKKCPLLVISDRMAEHAASLGFVNIFQATNASNDAICEALERMLS